MKVTCSVLEFVSCEGGEWKIQLKNLVKEWKFNPKIDFLR